MFKIFYAYGVVYSTSEIAFYRDVSESVFGDGFLEFVWCFIDFVLLVGVFILRKCVLYVDFDW